MFVNILTRKIVVNIHIISNSLAFSFTINFPKPSSRLSEREFLFVEYYLHYLWNSLPETHVHIPD